MWHASASLHTGFSLKRALPFLALSLLSIVSAALADERSSGPNGGQIKDAGKNHLELVVKENAIVVYVMDGKGQKIMTKGASGSATVLSGKNTANVKLEASGENALSGSGQFESTPDMKVVVSVTLSGQDPVQARFTPMEKPKAGK